VILLIRPIAGRVQISDVVSRFLMILTLLAKGWEKVKKKTPSLAFDMVGLSFI